MKFHSLIDDCFSVFWFRRAGYSGLQAEYSELHGPESPGSYPESPGLAGKHIFLFIEMD